MGNNLFEDFVRELGSHGKWYGNGESALVPTFSDWHGANLPVSPIRRRLDSAALVDLFLGKIDAVRCVPAWDAQAKYQTHTLAAPSRWYANERHKILSLLPRILSLLPRLQTKTDVKADEVELNLERIDNPNKTQTYGP